MEHLAAVYAALFFNDVVDASEDHKVLVDDLASGVLAGSLSFAEAYTILAEEAKGSTGAIAAAYKFLTGQVPNEQGFAYLLEVENAGDFGTFNVENRYINQFNALAQGNPEGINKFKSFLAPDAEGDEDLVQTISNLYDATTKGSASSRAGAIEYLTRAEALAFYRGVAEERILSGSNPADLSLDQAAAVIALGSIVNIAVREGTPGLGYEIDGMLDAIAASAFPSIIFTGILADRYANGTSIINDNNYLDSTKDNATSVFISGGEDLEINADFNLRGQAGSVIVSGIGSSLSINDDYFAIAAGPGIDSNSVFTIEHGASAAVSGDFALAARRVFLGDSGEPVHEVGGSTTGILNVLNGGHLSIDGHANFAAYFPRDDDLNDGSERAEAIVNVSGENSKLFVHGDYAQFGVIAGGTATLSVSNSGYAEFAGGASFGNIDGNSDAHGGTGLLSLAGAGSRVAIVTNGIDFGRGAGSSGQLLATDGATLIAGDYLQFGISGGTATALIQHATIQTEYLKIGGDGGQADVTVDNASLIVRGVNPDGFGATLRVGEANVGVSTLSIVNGGELLIDGEGGLYPGFDIGRQGGSGSMFVTGEGSSVVVTGDAPDTLDSDGFPGIALIRVGRDSGSTGLLRISEGGSLTNSENGAFDVGRDGGSGTAIVEGLGSLLDAGAVLRVGRNEGQGHVVVSDGGMLVAGMATSDGETDISVRTGGTLSASGGAVIVGDIASEGLVRFDLTSALSLTGDLDQHVGGTLEFYVTGPDGGFVTVAGDVFLDGSLNIEIDGSLDAGDSFILFEATSNIGVSAGFDVTFNGLDAELDAQVVFTGETAMLVVGTANSFADEFAFAA